MVHRHQRHSHCSLSTAGKFSATREVGAYRIRWPCLRAMSRHPPDPGAVTPNRVLSNVAAARRRSLGVQRRGLQSFTRSSERRLFQSSGRAVSDPAGGCRRNCQRSSSWRHRRAMMFFLRATCRPAFALMARIDFPPPQPGGPAWGSRTFGALEHLGHPEFPGQSRCRTL